MESNQLLRTSKQHFFSFRKELIKCLNDKNEEGLKEILCKAFTKFNPVNKDKHPLILDINMAIILLENNGWKVNVTTVKNKGKQIVLTKGNTNYNSNYKH